jgi:hypothetical protein
MKRITRRALTLAGGVVLAGALAPAVTASTAASASARPAADRAITVIPLTAARSAIRGVTAGPASRVTLDSSSGDTVEFTLRAIGNYTTYVKVIQDNISYRTALVPQGKNAQFGFYFPDQDPVTVYDFGIYNVSKKVFDVNTSGGPAATFGQGDSNPSFLIDAAGTTTDPFGAVAITGGSPYFF